LNAGAFCSDIGARNSKSAFFAPLSVLGAPI
jgi:hypothetical protein